MSRLSESCIYTLKHSDLLAAETKSGGTSSLTEGRPWRTGETLLADARRAGASMPLLFSAAETETELIYWAIIEDIVIDADGETTCTYSNLRRIDPPRPRASLQLLRGGRLKDSDIRPYRLCRTPSFIR
jgi:hypothetical protein